MEIKNIIIRIFPKFASISNLSLIERMLIVLRFGFKVLLKTVLKYSLEISPAYKFSQKE